MKKLICFAFVACAALAQAVSVSNVSARQRWPWNNLVDVTFTVEGTAGTAYGVELNAVCAGGKRKLTCKTLLSEPIARVGANRIVWDFGRDYPDFKADDMQVSVLVTPFSDLTPVYLVIDVSGGASSASYPVRYTTQAPVHTLGSPDACKTTEIWLKRVKAGTGTFGGNRNYGYPTHTCTLTEDYYLGIFPVTQAQWEHVGSGKLTGSHSFFTNPTYAATRPVDNVGYEAVRDGSYGYPKTVAITQDTFIRRLRDRTGLSAIDLPTDWQWEYACRAGATTGGAYPDAYIRRAVNSLPEGKTAADKDASWSEDFGTCYVDRDTPNPWGFYSMLGNVHEWCANCVAGVNEGDVLSDDYKGPELTGTPSYKRSRRGGCWASESNYNCLYFSFYSDYGWTFDANTGFRIALTIPKAP